MNIQFSEQQESALRKVNDWLKEIEAHGVRSENQVFRLFGYAGTGKSTILKYISDTMGMAALFVSFTGKAVAVLRRKGIPNADTIHSVLYKPRSVIDEEDIRARIGELNNEIEELSKEEDTNEEELQMLHKALRTLEESVGPQFSLSVSDRLRRASIIVVDECSMVSSQIGMDLINLGKPILAVGDPFQLPPVRGVSYFTRLQEPDVFLQEVHRQARDSGVISLATHIRQGLNWRSFPFTSYDDLALVKEGQHNLEAGLFQNHQYLVGRHKLRKRINSTIRRVNEYFDEVPEQGEKLIVTENNKIKGMMNGSTWIVNKVRRTTPLHVMLDLVSEDGSRLEEDVRCPRIVLEGRRNEYIGDRTTDVLAEWGYAITVHKAQGSEWNSVTLFAGDSLGEGEAEQRWLYTGVTRASTTLEMIE